MPVVAARPAAALPPDRQRNPPPASPPGLRPSGYPNMAAPVTFDLANGATLAVKLTRDLRAGDKVFFLSWSRGTANGTISTVTNDGGYSLSYETFSQTAVALFLSLNIAVATVPTGGVAAGTTFTITLTAATSKRAVGVFTVAGLVDATVDQAAGTTGSSAAPASGATGTTTTPDSFVVGFSCIGVAGNRFTSGTTGYEQLFQEMLDPTSGSPMMAFAEWKTAHTTETEATSQTTASSSTWGAEVLAYKIQMPTAPPAGVLTMRTLLGVGV